MAPPKAALNTTGSALLALPRSILEYIFTFLDLNSLRQVALVCRRFSALLADENSEIWRLQATRRLSAEVLKPPSELLSDVPSYKAKLRSLFHAWDPAECSRNIFVKASGFTIHRNPVAQSTDAAKGKIGFYNGRHCWEVWWEGPLGTVAVIGVSTKEAPVQCAGYVALLGSNSESWGWNLVDNVLLHNGDNHGIYPQNNTPKYQVGERIRVILDCEDQTLSFERANCEFLGVAFRGLPERCRLYPAVSAVYGNTEVSMVYLGQPLDG